MPGSPSYAQTQQYVFWSADAGDDGSAAHSDEPEDVVFEGDEEEVKDVDVKESWSGKSMYVTLFEEMLETVLRDEEHLFSDAELQCFKRYVDLSYNAKFLLVRLCLRKSDQWIRLDAIKYQKELGEGGMHEALNEILGHASTTANVKEEEQEVVDLTLDSDDDHQGEISRSNQEPECEAEHDLADGDDGDLSAFAESDTSAPLDDLLGCLTLTELRDLAKQVKVKASGTRFILISSIKSCATTQTTLLFRAPRNGRNGRLFQRTLGCQTQEDRLREIVMGVLVRCVKINRAFIDLLKRVNLVFLRSTSPSSFLILPILVRAKKRIYATCEYRRTPDIWPSREALLDYEEALELEAQVDQLLGSNTKDSPRSRQSKSRTPGVLLPSSQLSCGSQALSVAGGGAEERARARGARQVKVIFEGVYPRWKEMVKEEGKGEVRLGGLERFNCGHVLTRIVYKSAQALGILREYTYELEVLEALLSQRRWRRGKRGAWHDRRALILMTHLAKLEESEEGKEGVLKEAMDAVIEGLEDDDTHIVYRPKLVRRLKTLEKRLKLPLERRHQCEGELRAANDVTIEGVRIPQPVTNLRLDRAGRVVTKPGLGVKGGKENKDGDLKGWVQMTQSETVKVDAKIGAESPKSVHKGKSVWRGRDEEEVNVEELALQYYQSLGFQGFHSESTILLTIFGLLFFDILFAPIPGAFETPYQTAPLDLSEDSFYFSRQKLIENRLEAIMRGEGRAILERVDKNERGLGTWCVGVRWEVASREVLGEIVDCLGGEPLAVICRLLCEDYASRAGGVPDLVVWNASTKECRFVEVKGPGDRLQENQKIWVDVLLASGATVEVCHVVEKGSVMKQEKGKKAKRKAKKRVLDASSSRDGEDFEPESEDEDDAIHAQSQASAECSPRKRARFD